MSARDVHQVTVEDEGRVLAAATVQTDTDNSAIHADLRVEPGHQPMGTRARLVDAVLDEGAAHPGTQVEMIMAAGEGEILEQLRERCDTLEARRAGASMIAQGSITDH